MASGVFTAVGTTQQRRGSGDIDAQRGTAEEELQRALARIAQLEDQNVALWEVRRPHRSVPGSHVLGKTVPGSRPNRTAAAVCSPDGGSAASWRWLWV